MARNTEDIATITEKYYPFGIVDFVRSLDKCGVSTVTVTTGGIIECLLCDYKVPKEHLDKLMMHVSDKEHTENIRKGFNDLLKFHNFWQQQTPEVWKNHLQFKCVSGYLRCVNCNRTVKYVEVATHVSTCSGKFPQTTSKLEISRGVYHTSTKNTLFQEVNLRCTSHKKAAKLDRKRRKLLACVPKRGIFQTNRAHPVLFKGVPSMTVDGESYPMYQKHGTTSGTEFLCLICNVNVGLAQERERHDKSVEHVQRQTERAVQISLARYHRLWNTIPSPLWFKQTNFQRGLDCMMCTFCPDSFVNYNIESIKGHLTNMTHPIIKGWKEIGKERRTQGTSKNRCTQNSQVPKSKASSSSVVSLENPHHKPVDFPLISDDNKTGVKRAYESPEKIIKIEEETAEA